MATYYSSSNNQRDGTPILYSREHLATSYPDNQPSVLPPNMMIYMNAESYSDALAANSQQQSNCIDMSPQQQGQDVLSSLAGHDFSEWREAGKAGLLANHANHSGLSVVHGGHSLQGQGLSLSLGTQIPSMAFRSPGMQGFSAFLSPNSSSSRDEQPRGVEYLAHGFPGADQDSNKGDFSPYGGMASVARAVPSSKYLKAAQQLLDEVVNVRKALKHHEGEKEKSGKEGEEGSKSESTPPGGGAGEEGSNSQQPELSHMEKQDLQNKLTKLLSMLDEVDRRYKQYYHQMQIVVSSFDAIAGCGSAKPYTALALQTISRHFRCLRDAIIGQIKVTRKSLGEDDASGSIKGVGISRLRYVDQQLRQQRALQQLGMMQQHAWRPQRGLPESSVSILRAWLFEHFLHPYPKDSDKIMLARQTGLTRSQVSNWFINARVRLWKPMVEEMYKEETGDADMDSNSSSENAGKAAKGDIQASEEAGEDMQQQQSASTTGTERCSTGQFMDSKTDHIIPPEVDIVGPEYGLMMKRREEHQRPGMMDECGPYPDAIMAAAAYHMSEMGRFGGGGGGGGGVSLTLGLQHCDGGAGGGGTHMPMAHHHHHSFVGMRGVDDMYNAAAAAAASSVGGPEGADFECVNSGNQQPRFASSSHLLHDFVV